MTLVHSVKSKDFQRLVMLFLMSLSLTFVQNRMAVSTSNTVSFSMKTADLRQSFRCLHIPTFMAQYQDFLTWRHLGRLSIEQASYLALYCTCLCMSLHLMDESHLRALNISMMARDRLAKSYSELTEKLFARVDWAQNHRIETLQAFVCVLVTVCSFVG